MRIAVPGGRYGNAVAETTSVGKFAPAPMIRTANSAAQCPDRAFPPAGSTNM